MWETEEGRIFAKAEPRQKFETISKDNQKGLECGSSGRGIVPAWQV
jgi:hypothetical protein